MEVYNTTEKFNSRKPILFWINFPNKKTITFVNEAYQTWNWIDFSRMVR